MGISEENREDDLCMVEAKTKQQEMPWTVLGENKGKVVLVSKSDSDGNNKGILHNGSYLTIEDKDDQRKFVLRVEDSLQVDPYTPSPLIIDMDLSPLFQDQKCQNILTASRIVEYPERNDGRSSYIRPQSTARMSTQEEVDLAFGNTEGIPVFPATVFARSSQHLRDGEGRLIQAKMPEDVFFHQTLITGSTGSGKTVAMKYLAQYFVEKLDLDGVGPGAVLAVNVKEDDMLTMDRQSETSNPEVEKEWIDLSLRPHGIDTFTIYYPGNEKPTYDTIDPNRCEGITLRTENIDPEAIAGLIQNLTELGADQLPSIFRYWRNHERAEGQGFGDFIRYFQDPENDRAFTTENLQGDQLDIRMHSGTFNSVRNALVYSAGYFDVEGAKELAYKDILQPGKMSVIDVTPRYGMQFGSVLLRDLLGKIYGAKSEHLSDVPVLIIIDEVHEFYNTTSSREALQTLDTICRKGRSLRIGVIFASQNPEDIPRGISNVVNTKIHFKSDHVTECDPEALTKGYAVARVHELGQLRFVKFPLSLAGVHECKKKK